MQLLHLTDFHYGNPFSAPQDPSSPALQKSLPIQKRLEICKKSLADTSPEALILSGDFSMDGNPADTQQLMQWIDHFFPGLPTALVPGNHDHPADPLQTHSTATDYIPSDKVCHLPDLYAICLDSSRPGSDLGVIDQAQCQWLQQQLEELKGQPAILITHYHLLSHQHSMPCASFPDEFTEIIAQSSLTAILTGHTHCHYQGFFAGKPCFTAPSFAFYGVPSPSGDVALEPCFGYNLYTMEKGVLVRVKTETFY